MPTSMSVCIEPGNTCKIDPKHNRITSTVERIQTLNGGVAMRTLGSNRNEQVTAAWNNMGNAHGWTSKLILIILSKEARHK